MPVVIAANTTNGPANLAAFLAAAKTKPGSLSYGSPGNGSTPHLAMEMFARAAGAQVSHVAYKGR